MSINKSILGKAIFALSVVAVTATAGVAGFAQAARHPHFGFGYGGNGAIIRAAVEEFQRAVRAAANQFQADAAACAARLGGNSHDVTDFNTSGRQAISDFSAQTAAPAALGNAAAFDAHFAIANAKLQMKLDANAAHLAASLDRLQNSQGHQDEFRMCMKTARDTY